MINNTIKKYTAGFTLVETLIAVFILSVSIAGPLTIASRALLSANIARNQVIAFYLAQDALEYVRAKRDTTCLSSVSPCSNLVWLTPLVNCGDANGCYLDSLENSPSAPTSCPVGGCIQSTFANSTFLYYDTVNNRFCYPDGVSCVANGTTVVKSPFARSVEVALPSDTYYERQIKVRVSWSDAGSAVRTVTISEDIFNWQ